MAGWNWTRPQNTINHILNFSKFNKLTRSSQKWPVKWCPNYSRHEKWLSPQNAKSHSHRTTHQLIPTSSQSLQWQKQKQGFLLLLLITYLGTPPEPSSAPPEERHVGRAFLPRVAWSRFLRYAMRGKCIKCEEKWKQTSTENNIDNAWSQKERSN